MGFAIVTGSPLCLVFSCTQFVMLLAASATWVQMTHTRWSTLAHAHAHAHAHANFITPARNHCHIWQHSQTMSLSLEKESIPHSHIPATSPQPYILCWYSPWSIYCLSCWTRSQMKVWKFSLACIFPTVKSVLWFCSFQICPGTFELWHSMLSFCHTLNKVYKVCHFCHWLCTQGVLLLTLNLCTRCAIPDAEWMTGCILYDILSIVQHVLSADRCQSLYWIRPGRQQADKDRGGEIVRVGQDFATSPNMMTGALTWN